MEIKATHKAKSKAFRMLPLWEMKEKVQNLDGRLYETPSGSYALVVDAGSRDTDRAKKYVLLFRTDAPNCDRLIVTQRHIHGEGLPKDGWEDVPPEEIR